MTSDPEPRYLVALHEADGAIPECYPNGEHRFSRVDAFEVEARVFGVVPKEPIRFLSSAPDLRR